MFAVYVEVPPDQSELKVMLSPASMFADSGVIEGAVSALFTMIFEGALEVAAACVRAESVTM